MQFAVIFGTNRYVPVHYYRVDRPKRKMYGWLTYHVDASLTLFLSDPRDDEYGLQYDVTLDGKEYISDRGRIEGQQPYISRWELIPKKKKRRRSRRKKQCPSSPTGKHVFSKDLEYDSVNPPTNCEHCGTAA